MDPNIQILSQSKEAEEDRSLWKIFLLFILNAGAVWGAFYFLKSYLYGLIFPDLLFFLILFFISLILSVLEIIFIKSIGKIFIFTFLEFLLPLLLFIEEIKLSNENGLRVLFLAFIVGLYFIFIGKEKGFKRLNNSLNIKFFEVAGESLKRVTFGLFLIFSVLFYLIYFVWHTGYYDLDKKLVGFAVPILPDFTKVFIPGLDFKPEDKLDNVIRSFVLYQAKKSKLDFNIGDKNVYFSDIPQDIQKKIIDSSSLEIEKKLKESFDFFNPQMTVIDFVYRIVKKYFGYVESYFGFYTNIGIAALVFVLLKTSFVFISWFVELIAFLIFKMLIIMGFGYVTLETKTREFVVLS